MKSYTLISILEEDNRKPYTREGLIIESKAENIPAFIKRHTLLDSVNTLSQTE